MIGQSIQDTKTKYYYHIVEFNANYVKANCYNQRALNSQLQFSRSYFNELIMDGGLVVVDRSNIIGNKSIYLG
jgi:hypothetical protein